MMVRVVFIIRFSQNYHLSFFILASHKTIICAKSSEGFRVLSHRRRNGAHIKDTWVLSVSPLLKSILSKR